MNINDFRPEQGSLLTNFRTYAKYNDTYWTPIDSGYLKDIVKASEPSYVEPDYELEDIPSILFIAKDSMTSDFDSQPEQTDQYDQQQDDGQLDSFDVDASKLYGYKHY